ncbi:MAG: hypothetical protein VB078_05085 [Clostridiaceae bacterium]|nr:hypothetical protein [Clostridiaceae bacterium]
MTKKKKYAVLAMALLLCYVAVWFALPYRRYRSYTQKSNPDYQTEVYFPNFFSFKGKIVMVESDYASLVIEPGVFSGSRLFISLKGVTKEYLIETDSELIPLAPVNEETEILLDQSRERLLDMLKWAESAFGI